MVKLSSFTFYLVFFAKKNSLSRILNEYKKKKQEESEALLNCSFNIPA